MVAEAAALDAPSPVPPTQPQLGAASCSSDATELRDFIKSMETERAATEAVERLRAERDAIEVLERWGEPQPPTIAALRELASPAFRADPARVTARDPSPALRSEANDVAREAWLAGSGPPYCPTASVLRKWLREELISTADPATARLAAEAERARPEATDARGLMEAAAAAGWAACRPGTYTCGRTPASSGAASSSARHPSVHTDNLYRAHAVDCADCSSSRPCSIAAACELLREAPFPWAGDTPPPPAASPPPFIPYEPDLARLAKELLGLEILEPRDPASIKGYAMAFDAPKVETALSPAEAAAAAADPTGAATAQISEARARAFLRAYEAELSKPAGKSGAGIRAAWLAAQLAAGGAVKHRLVSDCSSLTDSFIKLPLRYATLKRVLERCAPGARLFKCDLLKGYFLVRLHRSAADYCGIHIQLDPGAAPVFLAYTRLPMGASPSSYIFSILTAIVVEIANKRMPPGVLLLAYLDDLFLIADTAEAANAAMATLLQVLAEVGAPENPKKREGPAAEITVLGTSIDTETPAVRLPATTAVKVASLALIVLAAAERNLPLPAFVLPKLAGNLNWAATVDQLLPAHTRALASATEGLFPRWWTHKTSTWHWPDTPLAKAMKSELAWLAAHIKAGALRKQRLLAHKRHSRIYGAHDASGATNTVAIILENVAFRFVLPDCTGIKVAVLESLAVPLLLAHTGISLEETTLVTASDALGACYWAASGKARDDCGNDLQRALAHGQQGGSISYSTCWLSRGDNYLADRGAAAPWGTLLEGDLRGYALPQRLVEVRVKGLPHEFLADWAGRTHPGFTFSSEAWKAVHPRGSK